LEADRQLQSATFLSSDSSGCRAKTASEAVLRDIRELGNPFWPAYHGFFGQGRDSRTRSRPSSSAAIDYLRKPVDPAHFWKRVAAKYRRQHQYPARKNSTLAAAGSLTSASSGRCFGRSAPNAPA